jgi:hypothetical protein
MRTASLSALLALTTLSLAACASPTDADEGESRATEEAYIFRPITLPPPPPPPPLPAYTTIQGYAGAPLVSGHTDGSGVTSFVRPELVASSSIGATYVIDKDPSYNEARLRIVFDTLGTVNPHVQTIARGFYFGSAAALAMDPATIDAFCTIPFTNDVWKVSFGGQIDRFAGALYGDDFGNPSVGSSDGDRLYGARFNAPEGLVRDASGQFYVADTGNRSIRIISPTGVVSTLLLTGAPYGFAPHALARDARNGVLYTNHRTGIFAISTTGAVSLVAGNELLYGQVDGAPLDARFTDPRGLAVDPSGNVFVAEANGGAIRKLVVDWGTSVTRVETVRNLAPSTINPSGSGGYGPNDTTVISPFGIAMWGNSLVFSDVGRLTVRRLQ